MPRPQLAVEVLGTSTHEISLRPIDDHNTYQAGAIRLVGRAQMLRSVISRLEELNSRFGAADARRVPATGSRTLRASTLLKAELRDLEHSTGDDDHTSVPNTPSKR